MKSSDSATARILVADNQEDVLSALRLLLKSEGYRAETVDSPAKALAALDHREFDAVLIDLNYARDTTSGQEGLALLARIQALDFTLPVVVMTAWGTLTLRWTPCAPARAISSKSRGTTRGCSRF